MDNLRVPYEIAKLLKEKGFKSNVTHYYLVDSKNPQKHSNTPTFAIKEPFGTDYNNHLPTRISAPLWQQVMDWFRNIHSIFIGIQCTTKKVGSKKILYTYELKKDGEKWIEDKKEYSEYYEALSEGIKESLNKI